MQYIPANSPDIKSLCRNENGWLEFSAFQLFGRAPRTAVIKAMGFLANSVTECKAFQSSEMAAQKPAWLSTKYFHWNSLMQSLFSKLDSRKIKFKIVSYGTQYCIICPTIIALEIEYCLSWKYRTLKTVEPSVHWCIIEINK